MMMDIKLKINEKYLCYKNLILSFSNIKQSLIFLTLIYCVAYYPIIRANVYYQDDIGRAAFGYRGWDNYSRYVSNFLSNFIHANSHIADISPLTQLIAISFLVVASLIVVIMFSDKKKISIWSLIAVLPIGLSPYFLECISYKFDSPYMALSVLVSIVPLLFYKEDTIIYMGASALGTILMCTTYQASSGIFPLIVCFFAFKKWLDDEDILSSFIFIFKSAFGYLIGLIIFKYLIMAPDPSGNNVMYSLFELPKEFINNLVLYYKVVNQDFDYKWKYLLIGIMFLFVFSNTVFAKKGKKTIVLLNSILVLVIGLSVCFGLYPALVNRLQTPRTMYGFGVFIAILMLNTVNIFKFDVYKNYISRFLILGLCWSFFVLCFVYGNALNVQQKYIDYRIQLVLSDINKINIDSNELNQIDIQGSIGFSPVVKNMQLYKNGILRRLIKETFCSGSYFGSAYFLYYFGLENVEQVEGLDKNNMDLKYETQFHTIYSKDNKILLILK
ncbi:MAG: glucosyltransferase domain-containing protein [Bacillota bacterium]|nr:glucosyltransferase domain-containing protein [Bacillota bacterium]NLP21456.1 hypothetical protein [Erysipelotrichaceae bacterium]